MADFRAVFDSVPPVTRTILLATALVTFPCLLGMIQPALVALSWRRVFRQYEVWRPFTSFFFGGGGFPLLYDFFLIYRNSSVMEKDLYRNDTAEYAWLHLMIASFIMLFNIVLDLPFLFRPLLHAQTYVWCRANPTVKVSLFGLLTIPTSLYPPALILLDLITGGLPKALGGLIGLLAGHLWWFVSTYLPLYAPTHLRRPNPLATPSRFRALFSPSPVRSGSSAYRPAQAASTADPSHGRSSARSAAADAVRHRWGGGQRLGGESL